MLEGVRLPSGDLQAALTCCNPARHTYLSRKEKEMGPRNRRQRAMQRTYSVSWNGVSILYTHSQKHRPRNVIPREEIQTMSNTFNACRKTKVRLVVYMLGRLVELSYSLIRHHSFIQIIAQDEIVIPLLPEFGPIPFKCHRHLPQVLGNEWLLERSHVEG